MYSNDASFVIKNENMEGALQAIKQLCSLEQKIGGGVSWDGKRERKHFCFVDSQEILNADTLLDALDVWRWEADMDENGICDISFTGEKYGDDQILFDAIAPYVEDGSYIQMCGEEAEIWRWIFKNGKCCEVPATLIFDDSNCGK